MIQIIFVYSICEENTVLTDHTMGLIIAGFGVLGEVYQFTIGESYHAVHYNNVHDGLVMVRDSPLLFEPGTTYSYSSYGYNMLSAAMEVAAGKPFTQLLQQDVFEPAGMNTARAENVLAPEESSVGYYLQIGPWSLRDFYTDNSYKIAGGGIIATTTDLVRFGIELMEGRLIQEATREMLFTPLNLPNRDGNPVSYGLGFRTGVRQVANREIRFVSHGGGSVGWDHSFSHVPITEDCGSCDYQYHPPRVRGVTNPDCI